MRYCHFETPTPNRINALLTVKGLIFRELGIRVLGLGLGFSFLVSSGLHFRVLHSEYFSIITFLCFEFLFILF